MEGVVEAQGFLPGASGFSDPPQALERVPPAQVGDSEVPHPLKGLLVGRQRTACVSRQLEGISPTVPGPGISGSPLRGLGELDQGLAELAVVEGTACPTEAEPSFPDLFFGRSPPDTSCQVEEQVFGRAAEKSPPKPK